jgi:RNA polymerase sigma factor (sigma-70 family)
MNTEEPREVSEQVLRARAGEEQAFAELVADHFAPAVAYAQGMLRDYHRSQDAAQEAFAIAAESLERLEQPEAFWPWLRGIVRHRCLRQLRARDLSWSALGELDLEGDERGPAREAELTEERGRARRLIASLPRAERQVMALFYVKDCSQREVAAFLGLPPTTVNNRLHTARQRLRAKGIAMTGKLLETTNAGADPRNVGRILSAEGPVIEAQFSADAELDLFDALAVLDAGGAPVERMKISQRLGDGRVRCLVTGEPAELSPGTNVLNTGQVGVGLSPMIQPVPSVKASDLVAAASVLALPRQDRPTLLQTGIKALDLFCPFPRGGSVAQVGIGGVGRLVLLEELFARLAPRGDALRVFCLVQRTEPDSVRGMLMPGSDYSGEVVEGVEACWVLTEGATDPTFEGLDAFDAVVYCTPLLAVHGLYPALDPLHSRSSLLRAEVVGEEHVRTAAQARELLGKARSLTTDPALLEHLACRAMGAARALARRDPAERLATLSEEERALVARARRLERFLTQPFHVAEEFTGWKGRDVALSDTLAGVRRILDGEVDHVPEACFLYVGGLEEVLERHAQGEEGRAL